jgi:hypothetical protein
LVPVHPAEFVIDPAARSVDEALGCAHITAVPKHSVLAKMAKGIYTNTDIGAYVEGWESLEFQHEPLETQDLGNEDKTLIIEYHGLIPMKLYQEWQNYNPEEEKIRDLLVKEEQEEEQVEEIVNAEEFIEVIMTIANGRYLLRLDANPMLMKDRAFIAAPYERIPNRFWGRGIGEKGINVARAIDAEMRARIDAMALTISKPLGINAAAVPPGQPLPEVSPGKTFLFNGPPDQAMRTLDLQGVGPETFNQTAELRLMMQQATGTVDMNRMDGFQNEKTGVIQAARSPSAKKANRVIANVERFIVKPLVHKMAWRYIQYDPQRYPATDVKFVVKTRQSAMARELQQQQYAAVLATVPAESPAHYILLKGMFENSALPDRELILQMLDQMLQDTIQQSKVQQIDPLFQLKLKEMEHKQKMDEAKLQLEQAKLQLERTIEEEKLALQRDKMILEGQLKAANIKQDAYTTQLQTQAQLAAAAAQRDSKEPKEQESKPSLVDLYIASHMDDKPKVKRVKVTRTSDGYEGVIQESTETKVSAEVEE